MYPGIPPAERGALMRGALMARLSAVEDRPSGALDDLAGSFRWHGGERTHLRSAALEMLVLSDGECGPFAPRPGSRHLPLVVCHGCPPDELSALTFAAPRFALFVWDGTNLRITRDALGLVPVFIRRLGGATWIATEIAPLLRLGPASPDLPSLARLTLGRRDLHRTGWEGVWRAPPGGTITLTANERTTISRWWRPSQIARQTHITRDAASAALRLRLSNAVRETSATGILVSGGFDSAGIAAAATGAGVPATPVHVHFPDIPECDERSEALAVSRAMGRPLEEVGVATPAWRASEEVSRGDVPRSTLPIGGYEAALDRLHALGIRSALDGHDGDTVLGRPTAIAGQLALRGDIPALRRLAELVSMRAAAHALAVDLVPPGLRLRTVRGRPRFESPEARYALGSLRHQISASDGWRWPSTAWHRAEMEPLGPRMALAFEDLETIAAQHDVDVRHPITDPRVLHLLAAMPFTVKIDVTRPKRILRDAFDLPAAVEQRTEKTLYDPVLLRRVDAARCLDDIVGSGLRLPEINYPRIVKDFSADPHSVPIRLLIMLARAHAFADAS